MKAVEWAGKFESATTEEEKLAILDEFGEETAKLIQTRTGGAEKPDLKRLPAIEGAISEQRNKFRAINNKTQVVDPTFFDKMVEKHAKIYLDLKSKDAAEKAQPKKNDKENNDGRRIANANKGKFKHPQRIG